MIGDTLTPQQIRQLADNGRRLCLLYRANAPSRPAKGADWETFSLACLARAHYTLCRMLDHPDEIDGAALARCVYEHIVTFAWVAIEPSVHYPRLRRWEYIRHEKTRKDLEEFGEVPFPMDPGILRRAFVDMAKESAPETADRALEAQKFWARCVQPEWSFEFRRVYANLFRQCSIYVHPTTAGLDAFIERTRSGPKIGNPRVVNDGRMLVAAVVCFADGLMVASHRFGWPIMGEVAQAMMTDIPF